MTSEITHVYVTKYATTAGIYRGEVDRKYSDGEFVYIKGQNWGSYKLGRDAFLTIEEARAGAEASRQKKIASLEKQLAKLRALKIKEPRQ